MAKKYKGQFSGRKTFSFLLIIEHYEHYVALCTLVHVKHAQFVANFLLIDKKFPQVVRTF